MNFAERLTRVPPRLAFWALAGLALVLGHDTIFLVQAGPGEALTRALRDAGHGYWAVASTVVALAAVLAAVATVVRLVLLRRRARRLGAQPVGGRITRLLGTWGRLFAVVAVGFALQENIEHAVTHGHVPGLGALVGVEYPLALPVLAFLTAVAALVAASLRAAERGLVAAIAAALARVSHRPARELPRPVRRERVADRPMARNIAGRAPPPRRFAPAT
ncbi:MAG: hypothetical protein K5924_02065 [Chloroflexi bacterium]|nr:hypothetical protein [Chloroflexota bacterium]